MALASRKVVALAGLVLAGAVAVGVVWQSGAESEVGPVRAPRPPSPLLKEPDSALRAALNFPPRTGTRGVLDCTGAETGGGMSTGEVLDRRVPRRPGAPPDRPRHRPPPDFVGRFPKGWHEPARTPEQAVENIMSSQRHRRPGTLAAALTYVVGERSDAAGAANAWGIHPDGRRLRLVPLVRHDDGEWTPLLVSLVPDEKPASEFASFDEWVLYDSHANPEAVWTWQGGAALYCGGLGKAAPVPAAAP